MGRYNSLGGGGGKGLGNLFFICEKTRLLYNCQSEHQKMSRWIMTQGKIKLPEARVIKLRLVLKVIWDWICFTLLLPMIGTENSRHFLNQSDSKLKSIRDFITRLYRDLKSLLDFLMSSHWLFFSSFDWSRKFSKPITGWSKRTITSLPLKCSTKPWFKKHEISQLDIIHRYHLLFSI